MEMDCKKKALAWDKVSVRKQQFAGLNLQTRFVRQALQFETYKLKRAESRLVDLEKNEEDFGIDVTSWIVFMHQDIMVLDQ